MSGRQYNMYNSQTAEGWKQRILKENLHNAPSLRVFADLEADDDNQSVSSIGSRATGVTRASVASSKASMASTAALSRVRKPHSPCLSAPTLSLSPPTCSVLAMLLHSPQRWPARQPDSPAHATRRVSAARTLGTPHLSRRAAHRPVPPCWRPVASARPDPNNACRTALDLPRQIEELEKKLEAERQCAPHPAVPRACGAGWRRVA